MAAAELATNLGDAELAAAVYAQDAVLESTTDGALERYVGKEAIAAAWRQYMSALHAEHFRLKKRLLVAGDGVIVNEWRGTIGDSRPASGIECWIFGPAAEVEVHRMYSFLSVRSSRSWRQRLLLLLTYPRTAMAFDRAQRRR